MEIANFCEILLLNCKLVGAGSRDERLTDIT